MQLVSDEQYADTITSVKKKLKEIFDVSNQKENKNNQNSNVILISLIPTFAFKQLLIYVALGEYLRVKYHHNIKYMMDDKVLNHCDMVNMKSKIDKEFLCQRCLKATEIFQDLSSNILYLSDFASCKNQNRHSFKAEHTLVLSKTRFCGSLDFQYYTDLSQQNLNTMKSVAENIMKKYSLKAFITLHHNSIYSLASMERHFYNAGIKCINLDQGAFKKNSISFFTKFGSDTLKKDIFDSLIFDTHKMTAIQLYLKHRTSHITTNNNENRLLQKIDTAKTNGKSIAAIFPNVLEDADWLEYHHLFDNLLEWLLETVAFLLTHNFHIIIKAHPAEGWWGVQKSALDYIEENFSLDHITLIPNNEPVSSYTFLEHVNIVSVYTGTLLLECTYKNIPVVPGGSSYITRNSFWSTLTKEEYFNSLLNQTKLKSDIKTHRNALLRLAYIDFFCRDIPLSFLDSNSAYPHVDISKILSLFDEGQIEMAFDFVNDLLTQPHINIESYIKKLEIS